VQVITGGLLFASEAVKIYGNPAFRLKMLLILVAGLQVWIFQKTFYRGAAGWDAAGTSPVRAKLAGGISLLLWISIVAAGRFIGFV
jgi:hypothetical protein